MDSELCREQILSEEYRDFLVSQTDSISADRIFRESTCRQKTGYLYESIYIDMERAGEPDFGRYPYNSIPKCYSPLGIEALSQAGVLQIQNYPTLELMGNGVLIGFVDTGIQYENQVFRNLDGTTRVLGIWDQTVQEGMPPDSLSYGTEYTEDVINLALRSENPRDIVPSRDTDGHGTFLASVSCGGADDDNQFLGAAPEAYLAIVKLKPAKTYLKDFYCIPRQTECYQENDIMLGISYLINLAKKKNLPLVICIALGTNLGSHDGTSPLAGMLELLGNQRGCAVVLATGNEASARHHYLGRTQNINDVREIEIRVGEKVQGFVTELWTDIPNLVSIGIESPSGERIMAGSVRRQETMTFRFLLDRTTVSVNYLISADNTNTELVFLRFLEPVAGSWKLIVSPLILETGEFHLWLPMTSQQTEEVYFLASNPDYTITEPGNVISAITTGFYDGEQNSIAIPSGRGYTKSGRIKPDFVAPGVDVTGGSTVGQIVERTGSSIAAGITAGAVALLMEWIVYRTQSDAPDSMQLRNLLIIGARKRQSDTYPNREWGYGALDLYRTFDVLRRI